MKATYHVVLFWLLVVVAAVVAALFGLQYVEAHFSFDLENGVQISHADLEDNDVCWHGSVQPRCLCQDVEEDQVVSDPQPQPTVEQDSGVDVEPDHGPHQYQKSYQQSGGNGPQNKGEAPPIANSRKGA